MEQSKLTAKNVGTDVLALVVSGTETIDIAPGEKKVLSAPAARTSRFRAAFVDGLVEVVDGDDQLIQDLLETNGRDAASRLQRCKRDLGEAEKAVADKSRELELARERVAALRRDHERLEAQGKRLGALTARVLAGTLGEISATKAAIDELDKSMIERETPLDRVALVDFLRRRKDLEVKLSEQSDRQARREQQLLGVRARDLT